jgi:hypothetical protein
MLGATVPDYSLDDDEETVTNDFGTGPGDDTTPGEVVKTKEVLDFFQ